MSSKLTDFAEQISNAAATVSSFLASNGHPEMSFDVGGPSSFPSTPDDVTKARQNLLDAAQSIVDLMTGPDEHLRWLACRYHDMSSLRWIYHFNIAAAIPLDRAISYTDVAASAKVDEDHLKRMVRHAMTNRLFQEPEPGLVAHTAASALLVRSQPLNDWVGYTTEETYPASAKVVEAYEKFGASQSPSETAYSVAFNTDKPLFVHLADFPERERRFANTMVEMTSTEGYGINHLVNGYHWEDIGKATVVDVGGSTGHACVAISDKAPEATFTVQDLAGVVEQGKKSLPTHLKDRITFEEHDFFTPQPVSADIYLLRFILHDHPDSVAVKIIQSLVPAMRSGSRLLINDGVLPEPNRLWRGEEKIARIMDLEMLTTFNARERPLADWVKLCAGADPRLTLQSVSKPDGSVMSILEFVLKDD